MQAAELAIVLGIAFLGAWTLTALTIYGASSFFGRSPAELRLSATY